LTQIKVFTMSTTEDIPSDHLEGDDGENEVRFDCTATEYLLSGR